MAKEKAPTTTPASNSANQCKSPVLAEVMKNLLLSGEYSDMTITCQGFSFRVHRAILCSQSAFFKAVMDGNFQEGLTKTIDLPDDDPETIERVIAFMYVGDYSPKEHLLDLSTCLLQPRETKLESPQSSKSSESSGSSGSSGSSEFSESIELTEASLINPEDKTKSGNLNRTTTSVGYNHLYVYIMADKFGLDGLKLFASDKLTAWCSENWQSVAFRDLVRHAMRMNPEPDWKIYIILAGAISIHAEKYVERGSAVPEIFKISATLNGLVIWCLARERLAANKAKRR